MRKDRWIFKYEENNNKYNCWVLATKETLFTEPQLFEMDKKPINMEGTMERYPERVMIVLNIELDLAEQLNSYNSIPSEFREEIDSYYEL